MNKPDFFIVGAPKSGTTAFYEYLKSHPDVFLPRKELYYFCKDFHAPYPKMTEEQYLSYYKDQSNSQQSGDASVWYLFSEIAAQEIKSFNPEAKILIFLRNPVDMIHALHSQHLFAGNEQYEDFEQALSVETKRKTGKEYTEGFKTLYEALFYKSAGMYFEQVKRYIDSFEKSKVKIILFDDFKSNAQSSYIEVLNFLNLSTKQLPDFKIVNPNTTYRSKALLGFMKSPPTFVKKIINVLFPHHSAIRYKLMNAAWSINSKKTSRLPIDKSLRKKLVTEFTPDILKLQALINRDLGDWLN